MNNLFDIKINFGAELDNTFYFSYFSNTCNNIIFIIGKSIILNMNRDQLVNTFILNIP